MLKRAVLTAIVACALALPATATAKNSHEIAEGTWNYVPTSLSFDKEAGQQVFISGVTADDFAGTFAGTGVQQFTLTHHANQQFNIYRGTTEFEGTVEDDQGVRREGTMTIRTVGKQDPGFVDPSPLPWQGTWVITSATGGLKGLHGHGTITGPSGFLDYTGSIHFTK